MKHLNQVLALLFVLLISTSCAQQSSETVMTAKDLKQEMRNNPNLVILDVRTPAELVGPLGQIEGVINIPIQLLENNISSLEKYKDKDIAVICRSGNRSTTGTEILRKHGYNARNVLGGMISYNKVKLP